MEDLIYKNINISLIYSTFSYLWNYNIRRSKNKEFMEKMKKEKPLDDIIHTAYDNSIIKIKNVNMHKLCDIFAIILPLSVLIPEYKKIILYRFFIELGVFQIYKQLICISTRLPPTGEPQFLSRKILGLTVVLQLIMVSVVIQAYRYCYFSIQNHIMLYFHMFAINYFNYFKRPLYVRCNSYMDFYISYL